MHRALPPEHHAQSHKPVQRTPDGLGRNFISVCTRRKQAWKKRDGNDLRFKHGTKRHGDEAWGLVEDGGADGVVDAETDRQRPLSGEEFCVRTYSSVR